MSKRQLRRCGLCGSVGHNKATCTNKISAAPSASSRLGTVKFFVHHVNTPAESSPHVVNLKTEKINPWEGVISAAPAKAPDSLFHSYHVREEKSGRQTPSISPLERGRSDDAPPSKLFSDLDRSEKKYHSNNFKSTLEKFALGKSFAAVIILAIGLMSFAPGSVRGYYEDLLSTKTIIEGNSTEGFLALQESATALKSADLNSAETSTALALNKFNLALNSLASKHTILQTIAGMIPFVHGELQSREKVLLAGEEIAVGNSYLISTLKTIASEPSSTLTYKLNSLVSTLRAANPNYEMALDNLNDVDLKNLPFKYQEQFKDFRSLFENLVKNFKSLADLNGTLQEIFGGNGQRRYLLTFQNPAELRPTGGFIGSFAILDVKDGKIVNFEIPAGGSYDLDGQLQEHLIPPLPLTLINKRWEFQDANWFPDFRASAEKTLWFYNHSRNATADGVIAINASVLERLLGIIGPISDSSRNLNLSSENALSIIQDQVENGPEKLLNKPKKILSDLAPTILDTIRKAPTKILLPLLGNLEEALNQKEIQAYFTDPSAESAVISSGWGGAIAETDPNSDYLLVVNTNLEGQKSDARIRQLISHEAVIADDGTVVDTVVITREHTGMSSEKFYGAPNIDYLRIYVPAGSTLLSASGFTWPDETNFRAPESQAVADPFLKEKENELGIDQASGTRITAEFNKTAFGNWVITEPGATSQAIFSYRLPFKVLPKFQDNSILDKVMIKFDPGIMNYRLTAQKQSGITSDFESQIIFPLMWQPSWLEGKHTTPANNGFKINTFKLTEDETWSVLIKKTN